MRVGTITSVINENYSKWIDGLYKSVKATHDSGYYHCDIRQSNILMFENDCFQLIDYDHAVSKDEPTVIFSKGGQYNMRCASMRYKQIGDSVEWTPENDYEMIAVTTFAMINGWRLDGDKINSDGSNKANSPLVYS